MCGWEINQESGGGISFPVSSHPSLEYSRSSLVYYQRAKIGVCSLLLPALLKTAFILSVWYHMTLFLILLHFISFVCIYVCLCMHTTVYVCLESKLKELILSFTMWISGIKPGSLGLGAKFYLMRHLVGLSSLLNTTFPWCCQLEKIVIHV